MNLKLITVSRDLLEKNSLQLINSPPLGERELGFITVYTTDSN